jgi:CheY-like chemotaxis protein
MKILVVDDNTSFLMLFQLFAEETSQFEFIYSMSGREALEILEKEGEESVSMVVCDVRMPAMSGIEVSQIVHEIYPKIPIILITGLELEYFSKEDLLYSQKILSKDIGCEGILEEIKLIFYKNQMT